MNWTGPKTQTWRSNPSPRSSTLHHGSSCCYFSRNQTPCYIFRWWGVRHWERLVIVQWSAVPHVPLLKTNKQNKKLSNPASPPALRGLGGTQCDPCSVRTSQEKEQEMGKCNRCNQSSLLIEGNGSEPVFFQRGYCPKKQVKTPLNCHVIIKKL